MPSGVTPNVGLFDRFAQGSSRVVSRALFFAFCLGLIVIWVPTIFLMRFEMSQLLINTATTIITFLMVALLQNSQQRAEQAIQHKLNAIADALADLMEQSAAHHSRNTRKLRQDAVELKDAVGLEYRESVD